MAFTEHEKARIRHFLGYPSFAAMSNGIQLGYPAASQPMFLLEQSFERIAASSQDTVRRDLCQCEELEGMLSGARSRIKASQLGNLKTNPRELADIRMELERWKDTLASDLGVVRNPHSPEGNTNPYNSRVTC